MWFWVTFKRYKFINRVKTVCNCAFFNTTLNCPFIYKSCKTKRQTVENVDASIICTPLTSWEVGNWCTKLVPILCVERVTNCRENSGFVLEIKALTRSTKVSLTSRKLYIFLQCYFLKCSIVFKIERTFPTHYRT
jgi:hypothetical protein